MPNEAKANFAPLTPLSFLFRGARFFGGNPAVIYGERRMTYADLLARSQSLAAALRRAGVTPGDRVAVLAPNTPPMIEAHFGLPIAGAVITPLNPELQPAVIGSILSQAKPRLLLCDCEYLDLAGGALSSAGIDVPTVAVHDAEAGFPRNPALTDYETFLGDAPSDSVDSDPFDELQAISLLYTSGTTGTPKGAVHTHRGAYLASLSNALSFGLTPATVHLWTWPMFHCNGLCFIWAVAAVGGTQVCLRRVEAPRVFELIRRHGVSYFCAAPSVMSLLASHAEVDDAVFDDAIRCITGGSVPPSSVIQRMEALGIQVVHQYGCTEGFGPLTMLNPEEEWSELPPEARSALLARQGSPTTAVEDLEVVDPDSRKPVQRDGHTPGEVRVRGNTLMDRYFGDPEATQSSLAGGWFRTGDVAVSHPDGSIEIKDRATDLIVSDGQRISSIEIEEVLHRHPDVQEAAVVAEPDDRLGEACCAFVKLSPGTTTNAEQLGSYCRANLEGAKVPRRFVFQDLPKTATGKIKKHQLRTLARRQA